MACWFFESVKRYVHRTQGRGNGTDHMRVLSAAERDKWRHTSGMLSSMVVVEKDGDDREEKREDNVARDALTYLLALIRTFHTWGMSLSTPMSASSCSFLRSTHSAAYSSSTAATRYLVHSWGAISSRRIWNCIARTRRRVSWAKKCGGGIHGVAKTRRGELRRGMRGGGIDH